MRTNDLFKAANITDEQAQEALNRLSLLARAYLPEGYCIQLQASRDITKISVSRIDGDTLSVPDSTPKHGWPGAIEIANRDWAARQQESR